MPLVQSSIAFSPCVQAFSNEGQYLLFSNYTMAPFMFSWCAPSPKISSIASVEWAVGGGYYSVCLHILDFVFVCKWRMNNDQKEIIQKEIRIFNPPCEFHFSFLIYVPLNVSASDRINLIYWVIVICRSDQRIRTSHEPNNKILHNKKN